MKTAEILEAAADLIEPPGAWIQGAMATNKDGFIVVPSSAKAVRWCLFGAILTATRRAGGSRDDSAVPFHEANEYITRTGLGDGVTEFNDDPARTQAEVVAALRAAAKEVTNGEA